MKCSNLLSLAHGAYALSTLTIQLVLSLTQPAIAQQLQFPAPKNPPVLPPNAQHGLPSKAGAPLSATTAPSLSPTTWTAIGPASLSGTYSGRITGIAVDPTNASNIYIAAAGGGVWQTTNGGTAWTARTDHQATLAMGAVAVAPSNHLKIYAGTGEANNSGDSDFGQGILVSNDGGATWSLSQGPGNIFSANRLAIAQLSVNPLDPNTAYAAVGLASENGTFSASGGTGIYRTTDGGVTWTNTTGAVNEVTTDGTFHSTFPWSAVAIDPNSPSVVYAAHGYISNFHNYNSANGVYRSLDGGSTWSLLSNAINGSTNGNTGRIAIAIASSANIVNHHVLYVAAESTTTNGLLYFERSDNADAATPVFTTSLTGATPDFGGAENGDGQGWYDWVIGVDPTNSSVVYAAGVECYACRGTQAVIRSTTAGASWTDISIVGGIEPHTDSHAIAFDAGGNMYLGNDGGIWKYNPTVPSWTDLNGDLNTIQFTGIALHPTSLATVLGGSQDNGTELYNGNLVWSQVDGGDGGFVGISQTNPARCYHTYAETSFERSDSSCAAGTWVQKTAGILNAKGDFYPPFTLDPTNGDHLLYGGDRVYETTSAGDSWTPISTPGSNGFNNGGFNVDSVAIAPGTNTRYASSNGHVFVTTNDGASWVQHDPPGSPRVKELDVDPNDATGNTVVAVVNYFNGSGGQVFRTNNGGTTWTSITANLPLIPTWSAKIDTDASHTIYISNETGVYASPSPYTSWIAYGSGLPNAQGVYLDLNRSLHLLAVATHGRGVWEILTQVSVPPALTISASHTGNFFQGQSAALYTVTVSNGASAGPTSGTVSMTDTLPSGLTLVSMAGAGWSCTGTTCTRSDVLNGGASYPAIAVTVNVAPNAASPQVNSVTVSGGGSPAATATDSTIIAPLVLTVLSVAPSSGIGNTAVFSLAVSDSSGTGNIGAAVLLINSSLTGTGGCFIDYTPGNQSILLANDSVTAWLGPSAIGSGAALSNSQCTVRPSAASVSTSGNNLTVSFPVSFSAAFAGAKTTWGYVSDKSNLNSGYRVTGAWTATASAGVADKIGIFNSTQSVFLLDANGNFAWDGAPPDKFFLWGAANHNPKYIVVMGDWDGSGTKKVGIFDPGTAIWLLDYNGDGVYTPGVDKYFMWGSPGDIPVVGDWNGSGTTKIGTFGPTTGLWLLDYNGNFAWDGGSVDRYFSWGSAGDTPVVGDWNGKGTAKVGTFGPKTGLWLLDYNGNFAWDGGSVDRYFSWGSAGDTPLVGDWNGSGTAKVGTFGPKTGLWLLDFNGNFAWDGPGVDKYFSWGSAGDTPVTGDWNGSGTAKVGTFGPGTALWLLDYNGNFTWDGAGVDKYFLWGSPGDTPVVVR
jgi:uncharacterized repeat protein (TIGR01451 family)